MRCVGEDDALCEEIRQETITDPCSASQNAGWTCDDSWGTKCLGDSPSGADATWISLRDAGHCPDWCGAGSGAREAAFALSRYIPQAGTFISAERLKYSDQSNNVQYC